MPDPRLYPAGPEYIPTADIETDATGTDLVETYDPATYERKAISINDERKTVVQNKRSRFTIAQVNAGVELLPAVTGKSYRMTGCTAIAIGGAVTTVTTVDVLGTQTTAVKLVAFAQASLTEDTVLRDGNTGAAVLAAGASYVANDAGTAITVDITGSDITVATHVDINFSYTLE